MNYRKFNIIATHFKHFKPFPPQLCEDFNEVMKLIFLVVYCVENIFACSIYI